MVTQTTIRLKTKVLPGHRIEVVAPELEEGQDIELIVLPDVEVSSTEPEERVSLLDFVKTVTPGPRPFATWREYERALQEEKEAWKR